MYGGMQVKEERWGDFAYKYIDQNRIEIEDDKNEDTGEAVLGRA